MSQRNNATVITSIRRILIKYITCVVPRLNGVSVVVDGPQQVKTSVRDPTLKTAAPSL